MREAIATFFSLPRLAQVGLDLGVSAIAFTGAYMLRFEGLIPERYRAQFLLLLPVVLLLRFVSRFPFGLHLQLWRYVSLREALDITLATSLGSAGLYAVAHLVFHSHVPWGILALDWGLGLLGYLTLRGFRRFYTERQPQVGRRNQERAPILLVGAGQAGLVFAREIRLWNPEVQVIGFVDDDPHKRGSRVHGVEVLGMTEDIPRLVAAHDIGEVILCMPSASQKDLRRVLDFCHGVKVKTKILPGLNELVSGHIEWSKIREVQIEDLLGRDPVAFDRASVAGYLEGRVVMVTGGGGSIGSELCRQIATLSPRQLVLVGHDEFGIYTIDRELRERFPALDLFPLIADVRDEERMGRIFERFEPRVVFHAAAHKHVPLMELNPGEAASNNVFGTRTVAELSHRHGVETFVLISSDKAVNPTSVMGATKRVAEMIVQELAMRSQTRFMSVRFGNVLGSSGSVIPLFKEQIAAGGPLTVTHPDVIRYFMTIPEACELVLQTGAIGEGGEVFVLDMGEPVRIVDLARDLIKLSGLVPERDIEIRFTGLRPGEKLFEELLTQEEGTAATRHKKIFVARPEPLDRQALDASLHALARAFNEGDDRGTRDVLERLVETYRPATALVPSEASPPGPAADEMTPSNA